MIPFNHSIYEFPFNLEDRVKYNINMTNKTLEKTMDITVKKLKGGTFLGTKLDSVTSYMLEIPNDKFVDTTKLKKLGYSLNNDKWLLLIE
jgi:hypothetical protein